MSDCRHHHNTNSHLLQGLLLGALIGAGFVFLFGTKRGKELAEELADKGLLALDDFEGLLAELEEETGQESENLPVIAESNMQDSQEKSASFFPEVTSLENEEKDDTILNLHKYSIGPSENEEMLTDQPSQPLSYMQTARDHSRRFFRGIPKRG